ncbi:lytic murein transglycosylase, partial [Bordetella hinzii]|nr:lytic murein transglycosylase [Bordetella hinzii]
MKTLPILLAAAAVLAAGPVHAEPTAAELATYRQCLADLRAKAPEAGVAAKNYDLYTDGLKPDMDVIGLLDVQPEFKTPIWDYMAGLVDAERIDDGRQGLEQWSQVLARVQEQYGVDPATVVAVWGVESNFGKNLGGRPLLTSLSTLSCFGRRQGYFRGEFLATLRIVQDEHVAVDRLKGSWAGAFGQTQFMPSTYLRLAVDFDG